MIKIQDWIASIPDEDKHIAYVDEGLSRQQEFLLCGADWQAYTDWSFHLDMAFDPTSITTHDSRQVVQTTVTSTESKEEVTVTTDAVTTKESYTVDNVMVGGHSLTDVASLAKSVTSEGIRLVWTVLRQHTQLPGKLRATLRAVSTDAQSIKKSAIMVFEVDAAIRATPASKPPVSEFEQMEIEMDSLRQQAFQSAEDARDYAADAAAAQADTEQAKNEAKQAADDAGKLMKDINLQLPPKITEQDDGKLLKAVNGAPVWVEDPDNEIIIETVTVASAANTVGHHALTLKGISLGTKLTVTAYDENLHPLPYTGKVLTRGTSHNLFPDKDANGVSLTDADGRLYVNDQTKLNLYFRSIPLGITYPAGTYYFGANVTSSYNKQHPQYGSDVGETSCTVRFLLNGTVVYVGRLQINRGVQKVMLMTPYPTGSEPQPFNQIALFSGSDTAGSQYVDAVYRTMCIANNSADALNYVPYDGAVLNLSTTPLMVTCDPMTLSIDNAACFEVEYKQLTYAEDRKLPTITATDNGKLLGVANGKAVWVAADTVPLPAYYDVYMADKAAVINTLMRSAARSGDAFVFITDQHTEQNYNAGHSSALIRYLGEHTKVNKVFSGGDVYCSNQTQALDAYVAEMAAFDGEVHYTMGNREYDYFTESDLCYAYDVNQSHQIGNAARHYYYVDNPQQKLRYVVLNGWTQGGVPAADLPEQLQWLRNVALQVEDGWGVILFTHQFFNRDWSATPDSAYISATGQTIQTVLDSYEGGGEILGVFHGHTHQDMINHTQGGIPVIGTTCDKHYLTSQGEFFATRTVGTVTEQAFDVVIVDRAARKFHCVRIGAKAFDGAGNPTDQQVEIRVVDFRQA